MPDERDTTPEETAHGWTRRSLLARAGVLAATAELGASTLASCGGGSSNPHEALDGDTNDLVEGYPPPSRPLNAKIFSFFTPREAVTVEAIMDRLIPGTADDPGARQAGVTTYIDLKLAQFQSFSVPTYFLAPFASPVDHAVGPQEHATDEILVETAQLPRYGYQSNLTPAGDLPDRPSGAR